MQRTISLATTPLGTTDMRITRVGFGAWAIGGAGWAHAWGGQDDDESVTAIQHAVWSGINWIDTAAVYGLGHSEEVVARALRDVPPSERPYVFTKGGMVWDEANPAAEPARVGRPDSLRREVEASLARLGVERIDLYQMHWPAEDGTRLEVYWQTMLDLKAEGKVRAVGLSNHSAAQLEVAERLGHADSLQPPFSAIRRDVARAELPWAEANESHNTTVAAVAVAWTLAWPGVTGAIVGARRPSQVDGWLEAATLELDQADLDTIAGAIERTGAGSGPAHPTRDSRIGRRTGTGVQSGREAA